MNPRDPTFIVSPALMETISRTLGLGWQEFSTIEGKGFYFTTDSGSIMVSIAFEDNLYDAATELDAPVEYRNPKLLIQRRDGLGWAIVTSHRLTLEEAWHLLTHCSEVVEDIYERGLMQARFTAALDRRSA
jgi:hypothetical protein